MASTASVERVGVSLSGGGVRALLFGLGALRAVIAGAEAGRQLTTLVGVSGGGIGAAYAANRLNLAGATLSEYDNVVLRPVFRIVTNRSLMFGTWHLWLVLLGLVVFVLAFPVFFAFHGLGLPPLLRVAAILLSLLIAVVIAGWRGVAIERAMRAALFPDNPPLISASSTARLVLTATDLGSGEPTYLTSRGVSSWRWGEANASDIPLVRAARATATFPFVFPALHLDGLQFSNAREIPPRRLALVDGGVYDNMGTEWLLNQRRTPKDTYIIIVNASRNLVARKFGFGVFGLGEWRVIRREQDIQYDASTAPRRRWLLELFKTGIRRGTIVRIDGNIYEWVSSFNTWNDERGNRARAILLGLEAVKQRDPDFWEQWPASNAIVKTTLNSLSATTAANLIRAAYLATAIQLHILEDWPAPEATDPTRLFPWADAPESARQ
jgi:predicted acylesterase/phospholipase RssA